MSCETIRRPLLGTSEEIARYLRRDRAGETGGDCVMGPTLASVTQAITNRSRRAPRRRSSARSVLTRVCRLTGIWPIQDRPQRSDGRRDPYEEDHPEQYQW